MPLSLISDLPSGGVSSDREENVLTGPNRHQMLWPKDEGCYAMCSELFRTRREDSASMLILNY